jgi:hypothetical protein
MNGEYQKENISEAERHLSIGDYPKAFAKYVSGKCPVGLLKLYNSLSDKTGEIERQICQKIEYLFDDKNEKKLAVSHYEIAERCYKEGKIPMAIFHYIQATPLKEAKERLESLKHNLSGEVSHTIDEIIHPKK